MKEKISISIDKDVINEVQKRTSNISAYINQTLKEKLSRQPSVHELLSENNQQQGTLIYAMRDALNSIQGILEKNELTSKEIEAIKQLIIDFNLNLDALEKSRIIEKRALELAFTEMQPKTMEALSFDDFSLGDFMESLARKKVQKP